MRSPSSTVDDSTAVAARADLDSVGIGPSPRPERVGVFAAEHDASADAELSLSE
jgi:hypothetical protein